jgi:hypothetical protein
MKRLLTIACLSLFLAGEVNAQQFRTPQPSPGQTVKQDFALSQVELNYSRPAKRGRAIFGDLVPFGKVWRTGANGATTLTFGEDVIIGGKKVPAGKYGLLTIPNENEWTIIITKQTDVTSPAAYKEDQDVVRTTAKVNKMPFSAEQFMIGFDNIKSNSMDIFMIWDNVEVAFPVTADVDTKVMAQIDNLMNKDNRPYFQAAMYYLESGKDANKALEWINKALEQSPNAFWIHHQKANALAKLGKKQEAIAAANKSIELAKIAKNDDYVALNEKLIKSLK